MSSLVSGVDQIAALARARAVERQQNKSDSAGARLRSVSEPIIESPDKRIRLTRKVNSSDPIAAGFHLPEMGQPPTGAPEVSPCQHDLTPRDSQIGQEDTNDQ